MLSAARRIAAEETGSVDRMLAAIRQMQEEDLYTEIPMETSGPFAQLQDSYQQLIHSIRELVEANKAQTERTTRAEISQLESQFNPHFIFNTLEMIRCLIKLDPQGANQMIVDFSALLRYSISGGETQVSLGSDAEYLERYMAITQRRHENRLRYTFDIPAEAAERTIPKLILQPILENAVKYGIRRKKELHVSVSARVTDSALVLTVADDGQGMDAQKLAEVRRELSSPELPREHFGLYNVSRRLWLLYGQASRLEVESTPGEGTAVTVYIPGGKDEI